jgi:hypothetical protein
LIALFFSSSRVLLLIALCFSRPSFSCFIAHFVHSRSAGINFLSKGAKPVQNTSDIRE